MNERTIFMEALERDDPQERAEYLRQACAGDEQLLQRVVALLQAHQVESSFVLDRLPDLDPGVGAAVAAGHERSGTVIGPYTLLNEIGEGGMGTVYMAEQVQPVRRRVALKIVKPGMDTRQVVTRFEAERQALALMDHPNIARVFDGGATDSGRPYFVMELVNGIPITDYCDRERRSIRERLDLFVLVCRAVQHAHQKGIIHRDLKPSNILVTVIDGNAVPKVIDFGIAKAVGQSLTDRTLHTSVDQFIGTPLYMSPEQAELSGAAVDSRSDVYALGVVLYELLTGTTPFDRETFRTAAFDEMRRIVREEEPPKPSTRLSALGDARTTVSANRKAGASRLDRVVRGELDWIVMRALEKDQRRRYETVNEFAADVLRYLSDQPVEASPPSAWYRFSKYARRNRAVLGTAAVVALALVAGTGVATWQAIRATQALRLAAKRQHEAQNAADQSKAVLNFLVRDMLGASRPEQTRGRDVKVAEVLANADAKIEKAFSNQPLVEAGVRHALAAAYRSLGRFELAQRHGTRSYELRRDLLGTEHPDTVASKHTLGALLWELGKRDEAYKLLEEAVASRRRTMGPEHPDTVSVMNDLAMALVGKGKSGEAAMLFRQAVAIRRRTLGPEHPDTLQSTAGLANALWQMGKLDEARKLFEDTLEIQRRIRGEEHPDTAEIMEYLADVLAEQGKREEARKLLERSLEIQRNVLGPEHPSTLRATRSLVKLLRQQGKSADARKFLEQTLEVSRRTLGSEHPATLEHLIELSKLFRNQGRRNEARGLLEQTLEASRRTLGPEAPITLASMFQLATIAYEEGTYEDARKQFEQVLALGRRILNPGNLNIPLAKMWLAMTLLQVPESSADDRQRALELAREVIATHPSDGFLWKWVAVAEYRNQHWGAAIEAAENCIKFHGDSRRANLILALAHAQQNELDEARACYAKSLGSRDPRDTLDIPRVVVLEGMARLGGKPPPIDAPRQPTSKGASPPR